MSLNEKQSRFCEEYIKDLNATQAALRAGYSEKTSYSQGQRLLKHDEIQDQIQKLKSKRQARTEITQDRVVSELAKVGFADFRSLVTDTGQLRSIQDLDDDTAGAISSVEVVQRASGQYDDDGNPVMENVSKIRMWDKVNALKELYKHTTDQGDDKPPAPLNIIFNQAPPVGEVRVTKGKPKDAS